jgi:hypothetical protein
VQPQQEIRGEIFIDRLGGCTQVLLALAGFGITLSRMSKGVLISDIVLASLFALEVVGAIAITFSKLPLMRFALWLFSFRVLAGLAYMGVVHGDKLARSTLGFPFLVALYCFARVRGMRSAPGPNS